MSNLWYALRIKPRCEKYVDTHLMNKGYETFLPTYTIKKKWSDRIKIATAPLFPGYTFCRFDVQSRLPILITPGVQSIVGAGKKALPVEEHEIEALRRVVRSELPTLPFPYLKVGEMVEIETGPLKGLSGIVVRIKNTDRLIVSISLLMRSVSVEVPRDSIRPVISGTAKRNESILMNA